MGKFTIDLDDDESPSGNILHAIERQASLAMVIEMEAAVRDVLRQGMMPIIKVSRSSLIRGEMPTVEAASYDA